MRLAAIQAHWLLATLKDTLTIEGAVFSFTRAQRIDMYNTIINQQDKVIRSLGDLDNNAAPVLQQGGENNEKGENNVGIDDNQEHDQEAAIPKEGG